MMTQYYHQHVCKYVFICVKRLCLCGASTLVLSTPSLTRKNRDFSRTLKSVAKSNTKHRVHDTNFQGIARQRLRSQGIHSWPLQDHAYATICIRQSEGVECDTHIESEFYTSKMQPQNIAMFCHCDGAKDSLAMPKSSLKDPKGPYSILLSICEDCIVVGRHNIVRAARQNAQVKQVMLDAHVAREPRRQEKDVEEVDASIPTRFGAEPLDPAQPGNNGSARHVLAMVQPLAVERAPKIKADAFGNSLSTFP